jgi:hypothetical protein
MSVDESRATARRTKVADIHSAISHHTGMRYSPHLVYQAETRFGKRFD